MNDDDKNKTTQAQDGGENSAAGQGQAGQTPPDGQGQEPETKTFTQAELNAIVQERLAAERKKMPSKDELAAYKAWQAEQKKDEPPNEEAERVRRELAEANAELAKLKNRDAVIRAEVAVEFADFVAYEVSKLVDDDTDFETALNTYIGANPKYKGEAAAPPPAGASGMRHGQAPPKTDGVDDAFYALNPHLKKT